MFVEFIKYLKVTVHDHLTVTKPAITPVSFYRPATRAEIICNVCFFTAAIMAPLYLCVLRDLIDGLRHVKVESKKKPRKPDTWSRRKSKKPSKHYDASDD